MKRILGILIAISLGGVLFSGYLSFTKLFTGICAFNEACPYFLGYPACWYGFGMFLMLFVGTLIVIIFPRYRRVVASALIAVALLGIIFSGNFVMQEINDARLTGMLGLSTCAYGFLFYVLFFIIALRFRGRLMQENENI